MEVQVHKGQKEEFLHLTTPQNHTIENKVHNKEQEEAPLLLTKPQPHTIEVEVHNKDQEEELLLLITPQPDTMEVQAYKEEEQALLLQTCALKINDKEEEHSPKQGQEEVHMKESDSLPPPPPPPPPPSLHEVEAILEYKFKNILLLEEAFTHCTYGAENGLSYERLEYIGDSVLNLMITTEQFHAYPTLSPGHLTRLRAANVDTEKLARVAIKYGLHRYVRHKKPLLGDEIQAFIKEVVEYPLHSNGLIDVPKILANIVESTIGAIFVDCGSSIETVWKFFKKLLLPVIDPRTIQRHPSAELNEFCQKRGLKLQFRDLWKVSEIVEVLISEELVGSGKCGSKKEIAHNRAAKTALEYMKRKFGISTSTRDDTTEDLDSPPRCNGGPAAIEDLSFPSKYNGGSDVTEDLGSPSKCNGGPDATEGSHKCNGGPNATEDLSFLPKYNIGLDAIEDLGFSAKCNGCPDSNED